MSDRRTSWNRRRFVGGLTTAATAQLLGMRPEQVAAEPAPETTGLRLALSPAVCFAPQFVAQELFRNEGFTDVQYVRAPDGPYRALAEHRADFNIGLAGQFIIRVDAGDPILILAGTHVGCFELFATPNVSSVKDLRGKTVAVPSMESSHHIVVMSLVAYVGLDPRKDLTFVTPSTDEAIRLLAEGKIHAMMGFPPEPQRLRALKVGHAIWNMTTDRPWSQYFCCMLGANRDFVRKHPLATKRALRAILKANDLCATDPEQVGRLYVERGFVAAPHRDFVVQAMRELPYARWRDYDAEDTVRFQSLRLHEAGLIRLSPTKIIAQGTDWRFINELKKELKG
jgi:NitT/TauT family transport system substrate-binding protein